MAMITRVARLFRADMHAVLDRIEEPDLLLRQAVREMQEALAGDERQLAQMDREHGRLDARETDLARSLEQMEGELDICFEAAKDDLARALIKRKLEAERMRKLLAAKREDMETGLALTKCRLGENRERLQTMRQKAELLAEEQAEEEPGEPWPALSGFPVREEDVEVAFLREQQKRRRPS